jgi:anaerobic ribonucleoside-triphosphate reductase activating protein
MSGKEFTEDSLNELLEKLDKPYIKGLTLSGGNPFESNHQELLDLIRTVKAKFPKKDIWVFSGFTLEESMKDPSLKEILDEIDVLVDGRFDYRLRDISIAFRGSRNLVIWVKDNENNFIKSKLN